MAVVVALVFMPAVAVSRDWTTDELREGQVSRYLSERFEDRSEDMTVWPWETMVTECTRILMNGSPEQNRDSARVRFTPTAQVFLTNCAAQKGFKRKQ